MRSIAGDKKGTYFAINRLETLADGVFAIAMTLLVFSISIPVVSHLSAQAELPRRVLELWPKFLSYMVSFLILGVMWAGHHRIFHYIKRCDTTLMWLNIFYLMFIALIPFSNALAGDYITAQLPFVVYGINLLPAFVLRYALWAYATGKHRLVDSDIDSLLVKRLKLIPALSSVILLLAISVSFLNTIAGYIVLTLMLVYGALAHRILKIN